MHNYNTKRDGVRVKILETGECFNSIQACADYLGVNVHWLGSVTRGNDGLCTCHGYHIIRLDSPRENSDITRTEYRGRPGVRVQVVETGEVYDSILACSKALDCSVSIIHDILHNNNNRHSYKVLHFKFAD